MASASDIQKIVQVRDQMLTELGRLQGMLAGIDRAIEIIGDGTSDDDEWTIDGAGNPTRLIGQN
jgi:hypothetical protein